MTFAKKTEAVSMADELWRSVEADQGFAFISDGINRLDTPEEVLALARGSLKHFRRVVRTLEKFLKKYKSRERDA